MNRIFLRTIVFLPLCFIQSTFSQTAEQFPAHLHFFLKNQLHFSSEDFQKINAGQAVSKWVDAPHENEVAVTGVIYLPVSIDTFLNHLLSEQLLLESTDVMEMGIFQNPPDLADLGRLTFDPGDLKSLKKVQIGNSKVKLSADAIQKIQTEIDWKQSQAKEKAALLSKKILVDYIRNYGVGGDSAMIVYQDKKYALNTADQFHHLVSESYLLKQYYPNFQSYLENYNGSNFPGLTDLICWVKTDMGTRNNVITFDHIFIYMPENARFAKSLIIAKQLYANHYFEASLGITALIPTANGNSTGFYLLYLNQSQIDALRDSFFKGLIRRKIRYGIETLVRRKLKFIRNKVAGLVIATE